MATITKFEDWLAEEGIETAEEMLAVYRPVKDDETGWKYTVIPAKGPAGNVIVTGGFNDLFLTPKSREAFIKHMDSKYELGVEAQYAFDHAMEKDD